MSVFNIFKEKQFILKNVLNAYRPACIYSFDVFCGQRLLIQSPRSSVDITRQNQPATAALENWPCR